MEKVTEIIHELQAADRDTFLENAVFILFLFQNDIAQLQERLGVDANGAANVNDAVIAMMPQKGISDDEMNNAIAAMTRQLLEAKDPAGNMASFNPSTCPDFIVRNGKAMFIALGAIAGVTLGGAVLGSFVNPANPNNKAIRWALGIGLGILGIMVSVKLWDAQMARIEKKIGIKISG